MLRDVAQGIADFIREDKYLHDNGIVDIVVEDKADIHSQISQALAGAGVCVLISVIGFDRVDRSPILQGPLQIQISCFEQPELNRTDESNLTAQGVSERIAEILHYHKFPFFVGQFLFKNFSRDDVDEANIVRGNYEVHTKLGYENEYFTSQIIEAQQE